MLKMHMTIEADFENAGQLLSFFRRMSEDRGTDPMPPQAVTGKQAIEIAKDVVIGSTKGNGALDTSKLPPVVAAPAPLAKGAAATAPAAAAAAPPPAPPPPPPNNADDSIFARLPTFSEVVLELKQRGLNAKQILEKVMDLKEGALCPPLDIMESDSIADRVSVACMKYGVA